MAITKAGTAFLKVDGAQVSVAGSAKFQGQTFNRETLIGASGVAGYKETFVAAFIECECYYDETIDPHSFAAKTDATVTLELNDDRAFTLRNARQVGEIEVDAVEGTFTLRFEGPKGEMVS